MVQVARPNARRAQAGFTLIELMVTLAIVAILASVAVPAYTDYLRRGDLPEGFTNLSTFQVDMEQYYQDHQNYGGVACADGTTSGWHNFTSTTYFAYSCALTNGGQGYTITATGKSSTLAGGNVFTIDEGNHHNTTQFKGTTVSAGCWLAKGDECSY
jgi:type IV pilus assembly protein PilE